MEWLSQNWVWLALAAGIFLLMVRPRATGNGCCGTVQAPADPRQAAAGAPAHGTDACCGGHGRPAAGAAAREQAGDCCGGHGASAGKAPGACCAAKPAARHESGTPAARP